MQILVTGATGFIGNHLLNRLIKTGHHVKVLVRQAKNRSFSLPWLHEKSIKIAYGDLRNLADVKSAVENTDIVFHLAGLLGKWGVSASEYYQVNVHGTQNLVKYCLRANVKHFIFLGTTGVMGHLKKVPADVNHPCSPVSHYEKSKYLAELKIRDAVYRQDFPATIIRSTHVYGPGDMNTVKLFKMIKSLRIFPLIGGRKLFQPIHVEDLVQALILCMEKRDFTVEKLYLVCGSEKITFKDFIRLSAKIMGKRVITLDIPTPFAWVGSAINEGIGAILDREPLLTRSRVEFFTRNHAYDVKKLQEDTGFEPQVDLKNGLYETIRWYKENNWL